MIADNFLDPANTFLMDTDRLLKNFRSKPGSLDRVLGALAHGVQTFDEIIRVTSLSSARKYLRLLIDAGLVERKYSLAQFIPTHKKRYQLTDPALRFYFRFLGECSWDTELAGQEVLTELVAKKAPLLIPTNGNWSTIGMHLLNLDQVDQGLNEMTKRPTNFQGEIEF